jgi:glycosyltransferase involved in cell wall biosynthesis
MAELVKLYITPPQGVGGVPEFNRALREAMAGYYEIVNSPAEAEIVHCSGLASAPCDLFTSHGVPAPGEPSYDAVHRSLLLAERVVAVSNYTAQKLRSAFVFPGLDLQVIHGSIALPQVTPAEPQWLKDGAPLALWYKTNLIGVNADAADRFADLAVACPDVQFACAVWPSWRKKPQNVQVTGWLDRQEYLNLLAASNVYLCMGVENYPLSVIEAMALGVPTLFYADSGTSEMNPPGAPFKTLEEAVRGLWQCLRLRPKPVKPKFRHMVSAYQALYHQIWLEKQKQKPAASIIITCHNLKDYIARAVQSALNQTVPCEVILIDDGSTDGSIQQLGRMIEDVVLIRNDKPTGPARARNLGVEHASADFVVPLDGDDWIEPDYLEQLLKVARESPSIGVVAPPWDFGQPALTRRMEISLEALKQRNIVPCCSLVRKRAWLWAGGQKDINPSWEDYDLWLTIAEGGWRIVAPGGKPLFHYTVRADGRTAQAASQLNRLRGIVNAYHPRLYQPAVSVVIPCHTHPGLVNRAVESVFNAGLHDVEVVVVFDGVEPVELINDPRVRSTSIDHSGVGKARNVGIEMARGSSILPLDDDDELLPGALQLLQQPAGIVAYGDVIVVETDGEHVLELPQVDSDKLLRGNVVPATALYPKAAWVESGGYREDLDGLEDWAFWIALMELGYTFKHVPVPVFKYHISPNGMRENLLKDRLALWLTRAKVVQSSLLLGGGRMGCAGCGKPRRTMVVTQSAPASAQPREDWVEVRYLGDNIAPVTVAGRVVRAGAVLRVPPAEAQALVDTGLFELGDGRN